MRTRVTVPQIPLPPPVEVGEIDTSLIRQYGRRVDHIGRLSYYGYAIDVPEGALIFVPRIVGAWKASDL